jgi:hypothetical protein
MSEHFLNRSQICSTLEEVGGEGMAKDVGMDAGRIEACLPGERAEDEERTGARERAALRVEEQLRAVAPVEVGPAA